MRYFTKLLLITILLVTSCVKYEQIQLKDVKLKSLEMPSTSMANVTFTVTIDNPTKTDISLHSFSGQLYKSDLHFADIVLIEPVTAQSGGVSENEVIANITLIDPLALLTTGINMKNWDANDFLINGKAVVRNNRGVKKSFKMKNMPINGLIKKIL